MGSIFRTADAAGVSKIYLCGITPMPPHPKITKASLGAETYVSWEYYKDTWRLLKKLKAEKLKIIALEQTKNPQDIRMFRFTTSKHGRIGLVVGNEVKGLSPKILKYCDKIINIPMYGKKESLNVSVATGIALYKLRS